ncbi:unnamed protein product [Microthlaspi erraticum]|uniref:Uncharacterized protein n=1 Tax=Microthlaspi erraticum TaxID=1685480 RepID=A0A6D2JIM1_9BRAS|nr:unnamed protein product [Microthlaspi erraticum]
MTTERFQSLTVEQFFEWLFDWTTPGLPPQNEAQGLPFEVVYYPMAGWSDFVVKAEDVEASIAILKIPGIRVKMAMETEDSSRITWFQGIISSTLVHGVYLLGTSFRYKIPFTIPLMLS